MLWPCCMENFAPCAWHFLHAIDCLGYTSQASVHQVPCMLQSRSKQNFHWPPIGGLIHAEHSRCRPKGRTPRQHRGGLFWMGGPPYYCLPLDPLLLLKNHACHHVATSAEGTQGKQKNINPIDPIGSRSSTAITADDGRSLVLTLVLEHLSIPDESHRVEASQRQVPAGVLENLVAANHLHRAHSKRSNHSRSSGLRGFRLSAATGGSSPHRSGRQSTCSRRGACPWPPRSAAPSRRASTARPRSRSGASAARAARRAPPSRRLPRP